MKNIKQSKLASTPPKFSCYTENVSSKYFHPDPSLHTYHLHMAIIYSRTTTLSTIQCIWQPAQTVSPGLKNLYLFTYTSQNTFFFSLVYYTLLPHQNTCLFPVSPTWSSLPVLKKNELHQTLPYLSQKWGRMDLVAEKRHDYNRSREEKESAVY